MLYVSKGPPREDEASCIDLSLEVGSPVQEPTSSLGSYLTYATLSPDQRASYLHWLSSGRVESLNDIGYAILFFYGLERRLLVDQQDLSPIVKEAVRLLERYTFSKSFDLNLSLLLAFSLARVGIQTVDEKSFNDFFGKSRLAWNEDFLAVALAWFYEKNEPLPVSLAIRIARRDLLPPDGALPDNLHEQTESLFKKQYQERFGSGLLLKACPGNRNLSYLPGSPSYILNVESSNSLIKPIKIPDFLGDHGQISPLISLWRICIEELRSSSRSVAEETHVDAHSDQSAQTNLETTTPPVTSALEADAGQTGRIEFRVAATAQSKTVRQELIPSRAHELRWYGEGESITVGPFLVNDPMVYISERPSHVEEASCIDLSLDVGQPASEPGLRLRTYPSYAQFSPIQRANYLHWLSNGRVGALDNIGYAFLFFYGLERRLLLEQQDLNTIVKVVAGLLETYQSSKSFDAYLNVFLAFSLARLGIDNIDAQVFDTVIGESRLGCEEDILAVALAWFYKRIVPLPTSWAIRIARKDSRLLNVVGLDRQPKRLESLFKIRYQEEFGYGLILKASSDERELRYRPANPSLRLKTDLSRPSTKPIKIPDVLGLQSQFYPLIAILARCVDDLRSSDPALAAATRFPTPPEPSNLPTPNLKTSPVARVPQTDSRQSEKVEFRVEITDRNQTVRHEKTSGQAQELRWCGKGEIVTVGAYLLRDPMIYVSEGKPREDEASCIDLSLEIGNSVPEPTGSLGYYPTYSNLSPNQRANYLRWLSNGRVEPLHDVGYAFLFFYGLERRLIVERQDLNPIVKEVVRLLETYNTSGSFDLYLSRFLAFTAARVGIETLKDKWFDAVFANSRLQRDKDFLAVALAWFFKKNTPLPVSWAMRISRQDPRSPGSAVVDRLPEQFKSLFEERYREQFGEGLILKASETDRSLNYRPASPSLLSRLHGSWSFVDLSGRSTEPIKIPDVLGIQSQFSPLATIWSSCIEELKPLSRVVGKGIKVNTREAFEALPDDLKAKVEHPDKEKWDRVVAEHTDEGECAIVQISKLATIHDLEERAKLTPKQSQALAQTAEYVGLVIEPDARVTNRPYNWEDLVSLLRPEGQPGLPTDSRYLAASLMLELGIYIAGADGSVEDVEVDQVARFLESQFLLVPPDARRLEALKRVFMARPPSLAGLGKRLQTALTREQREAVGRLLTGIAAANGIIDRKEVTALRNAYRALDIGVDQLNTLLEESRRASQEPVEVQGADETSEQGEVIPPKPKEQERGGFTLDRSLFRRIMAETEDVSVMLGKAMRNENVADEGQHQPTLPATPVIDPRFGTLDTRFHAMLSQLLTRAVWLRTDFNSLARELKLMPDGVLDKINEWSLDAFDDPIIVDQGGELEIQSHLLEGQS